MVSGKYNSLMSDSEFRILLVWQSSFNFNAKFFMWQELLIHCILCHGLVWTAPIVQFFSFQANFEYIFNCVCEAIIKECFQGSSEWTFFLIKMSWWCFYLFFNYCFRCVIYPGCKPSTIPSLLYFHKMSTTDIHQILLRLCSIAQAEARDTNCNTKEPFFIICSV